jgi:hypothetical protein
LHGTGKCIRQPSAPLHSGPPDQTPNEHRAPRDLNEHHRDAQGADDTRAESRSDLGCVLEEGKEGGSDAEELRVLVQQRMGWRVGQEDQGGHRQKRE